MRHIQRSKSDRAENRIFKLMVVIFLSTTFVYGCSQIRKITYPLDYVYLEKKEVRNKMALLSFYVGQMDEILVRKESVNNEDQTRVLELLTLINNTTTVLHSSNRDTNHFVIDEHMNQFKSDVLSAIRGAKQNPPNYFSAGKISGSCVACHKLRKN